MAALTTVAKQWSLTHSSIHSGRGATYLPPLLQSAAGGQPTYLPHRLIRAVAYPTMKKNVTPGRTARGKRVAQDGRTRERCAAAGPGPRTGVLVSVLPVPGSGGPAFPSLSTRRSLNADRRDLNTLAGPRMDRRPRERARRS